MARKDTSNTMFGVIGESRNKTEMTRLNLDDVQVANHQTMAVMGFRIAYGRTKDNKVIEFIKKGKWAKRDLKFMKDVGVVEVVASFVWAPKEFVIVQENGTEVLVQRGQTIELGPETAAHLNRWVKAIYG